MAIVCNLEYQMLKIKGKKETNVLAVKLRTCPDYGYKLVKSVEESLILYGTV